MTSDNKQNGLITFRKNLIYVWFFSADLNFVYESSKNHFLSIQ
jgi:hypothetical protein